MLYPILISLYIHDEFNYEKGFRDHKRIFRINTTVISDGVTDKFPRTTPPMAFGLAGALPEVGVATRTLKPPGVEQNIIRYRDKMFFEKNILLVDSTFLKVFDYKLLRGNPATALNAPSTVLISEKAAERIFGKIDPMDETIIITYKIEPGVMVFVISGLVSFLIAWLTIIFESLRAANRNPVEMLRDS